MSNKHSYLKGCGSPNKVSALTLTNSCYGTSYNHSSPLHGTNNTNTSAQATFNSSQVSSLSKSNTIDFSDMHMDSRNRSESVANTLNTHIDIENPQVWNDNPMILVNQDDTYAKKNKNLFQKYTLRLPNKLENEYLDHHFNSQIMLLRVSIIFINYYYGRM